MSVVEPPPLKPGDDLDGLLRRFFRSQIPHPWPAPRVPFSLPRPNRPGVRQTLVRSRWALAASIALLLLSSLLLPSRLTSDVGSENGLSDPLISDSLRGKHRKPNKHNETEKKDKPGLAVDPDDPLPGLDDPDFHF